MNGNTLKKHKKLMLIVLGAIAFLGVAIFLYRSQEPGLLRFKKYIKYDLLRIAPDSQKEETQGFPKNFDVHLYVEGEPALLCDFDTSADNKRVYSGDTVTRLVNYPDGYQMDFPAGTTFDFSRSTAVVEGTGEDYVFTVSFEYCPYSEPNEEMGDGLAKIAPWYAWEDATDQYIGYYQCRFLWSQEWQESNRVSVTRPEYFEAGGYRGMIFHAVLEDGPRDNYDAYSYVYLHLDGQDFLRVVVKYSSGNTQLRDSLMGLFASFRTFQRVGTASSHTDFYPVEMDTWSEGTRNLYHAITDSTELRWGIYTDDIYGAGIQETVPRLEQELDYTFRTILSYIHYGTDFPTDFMEENWNSGRIVELTYQLTTNNNENMFGYSPMLDIYRGQGLEPLREFARQARDFGHPFLFRLCNEMNSDWTSYGGVVNMADPNLFIDVYRTIYRVFEEEGVDNCIWIYNPNDRNAPPNKWNDAINYYPGNDYVQMIGITGYNNGTYYVQWGEAWREFDVIYDHIQQIYGNIFGAFPWMITEFSSSSVGGDKVAWIDNMFASIHRYPNIKIAVWFSSADWDQEGNVARPYWLDETPETTEAFRRGLSQYGDASWPTE